MTAVAQPQPKTVTTPPPEPHAGPAEQFPRATALVAQIGRPRHPEMPAEFKDRWQLAEWFAQSGALPEGYREKDGTINVARVFLGLQYAAELGLPPAIGIRSIVVINGVPSAMYKIKLAIANATGLLDDWWPDFNTDRSSCTYNVKRRGKERLVSRTFSHDDAHKAGLLGKNNWKGYEPDMLVSKAAGRALDEAFPELFAGLASADYAEEDDERPARPAPPPALAWRMTANLLADLSKLVGFKRVPKEDVHEIVALATGRREVPRVENIPQYTEQEYDAVKRGVVNWTPKGATAPPPIAEVTPPAASALCPAELQAKILRLIEEQDGPKTDAAAVLGRILDGEAGDVGRDIREITEAQAGVVLRTLEKLAGAKKGT